MPELTPSELTDDLLAMSRGQPYPDRGEGPIWCWQRWIRDEPERAWEVFEELVRRAPDEVEILEYLVYNLQLQLFEHWVTFYDRALRLIESAPLLDQMVGPELLTRAHYGPRYRNLDELATIWLRQDAHFEARRRVDDITRRDPELGLTLALEIIHRGPLHSFESQDLEQPLYDLLRHHGPSVIDRVEAAAAESEALRRVIWSTRKLNPRPELPHSISLEVWQRLMRAAGTTTLHNSPQPVGRRTSLGPEFDGLIDRWFISQECWWAWDAVYELVSDEPTKGWEAIEALVRHASDEALNSIGCGCLEDLIRSHPAEFVEQLEELARTDPRFRLALSSVWLTLEDVPEDLARRYWIASGRKLAVLDAPKDWATADEGP
jgi:uncharacterized protein DUF6869